MHPIMFAVQAAVVAYLVLGEPVVGKYLYARLNLTMDTDPGARSRFYRAIMGLEWFLVALVLGSMYRTGDWLGNLGLRPMQDLSVPVLAGVFAGMLLVIGLLTRFVPKVRAHYTRNLERVGPMIPRTGRERFLFGAVAITAGICEEILFRGFLIWWVSSMVPGLPTWVLIAISGVVFGLAHAYQGWSGILSTGLLGAMFAFFYLQMGGSLFFVVLLHAFIDLQALVISWAAQAGERKAA